MMVICPDCGRRYRIPETREANRRVRCAGCGRVFTCAEGAADPPESAVPRAAPLVVVGDEQREFRDLVRRTLESMGCRVEVTNDGEAAFRYAVAHHPDLMVLNVYLQKLLGVAVCEGIKGSPDLRDTRVALVGSVFKSDRFVRHTGNLYGADDYFEDVIPEPQLRSRLGALVRRVNARHPAGAPPGRNLAADDANVPRTRSGDGSPVPLAQNGADEPIDPRSEIHRLARIMVSDLKMYYPEEFRRAVMERRLSEAFREELAQAKDLIVHRFPALPDRLSVLSEALKEQIGLERRALSHQTMAPAP